MNHRAVKAAMIVTIIGGLALSSSRVIFAEGALYCAYKERCEKRQRMWEEKACLPVGARQRNWFGKQWPPKPRPTEQQQPLVHRYHAAHYWPLPYVCEDRAYIRNLSELQVASGWVTATTLYTYHFDADTNELNQAGEMQLRWILENTPMQYRYTFVQNAGDATINQSRLESVQLVTANMVGEQQAPPVMLRVTSPLSRPASEIDAIYRADRDSMPAPRIQYQYSSSSTGGGTGSN